MEVMVNKKQIPLLNKIPLTRIKITVAKIIYFLIKIFIREDHRVIKRDGISYRVDLSEGIDLSIFLFSGFQGYITKTKLFSLPNDSVIFDIGANIGAMSLQYAKHANEGHVYAFEPTTYAFEKLKTNLSLNPSLAERITMVNAFASDQCANNADIEAYSSWKIDGSEKDIHPLHGGTLKSEEDKSQHIPSITIDKYCQDMDIQRLDCIKIDTDGHELNVLKGAGDTLHKFHPNIVFEAGLYVIEEHGLEFEEYYEFLAGYRYALYNSKNNKLITLDNYLKQIPLYYTTDIIAIAQ